MRQRWWGLAKLDFWERLGVFLLSAGAILALGFNYFLSRRGAANTWTLVPGQAESPYRIDLNQASWLELQVLPGIGEITAKRIVEYRTQRGCLESVDDLANVAGVNSRTIERIRDLVIASRPPK